MLREKLNWDEEVKAAEQSGIGRKRKEFWRSAKIADKKKRVKTARVRRVEGVRGGSTRGGE
jgi:hypothetical protein